MLAAGWALGKALLAVAYSPVNSGLVFLYKAAEGVRNTARDRLRPENRRRRLSRAFYGIEEKIKSYQPFDA